MKSPQHLSPETTSELSPGQAWQRACSTPRCLPLLPAHHVTPLSPALPGPLSAGPLRPDPVHSEMLLLPRAQILRAPANLDVSLPPPWGRALSPTLGRRLALNKCVLTERSLGLKKKKQNLSKPRTFCTPPSPGPAWKEARAVGATLPGREALVSRSQGLIADGGEHCEVLAGDCSGLWNAPVGIN